MNLPFEYWALGNESKKKIYFLRIHLTTLTNCKPIISKLIYIIFLVMNIKPDKYPQTQLVVCLTKEPMDYFMIWFVIIFSQYHIRMKTNIHLVSAFTPSSLN